MTDDAWNADVSVFSLPPSFHSFFPSVRSYLQDKCPEALDADEASGGAAVDIGDLVEFYKEAKVRFDEDEEFAERSRNAVVTLQAGDESSLKAWSLLCETSRVEFQKIYDTLDVQVEEVRHCEAWHRVARCA